MAVAVEPKTQKVWVSTKTYSEPGMFRYEPASEALDGGLPMAEPWAS